jgi:hypothetical protein
LSIPIRRLRPPVRRIPATRLVGVSGGRDIGHSDRDG